MVYVDTPSSRQMSSAFLPDSWALIAFTICVSVNLDFFISAHLKLNRLVNFPMSQLRGSLQSTLPVSGFVGGGHVQMLGKTIPVSIENEVRVEEQ